MIDSNYAVFIIFCIIVAVGESIFSPRLYEYTLAITPKGKEGTYMALAAMSIMIGGFFAGMLSGALLEEFCPEGGSHLCPFLWFSVGIISITTIILLLVFRSCMEEPSYDPEPFCPCAAEAKDTSPLPLKN